MIDSNFSIFFIFVYLGMCVSVCACVQVHTPVSVQSLEEDVGYPAVSPCLRQGLADLGARLVASKPQRPSCLHPYNTGVTGLPHFLPGIWGFEPRSSGLYSKCSYLLDHLPSNFSFF